MAGTSFSKPTPVRRSRIQKESERSASVSAVAVGASRNGPRPRAAGQRLQPGDRAFRVARRAVVGQDRRRGGRYRRAVDLADQRGQRDLVGRAVGEQDVAVGRARHRVAGDVGIGSTCAGRPVTAPAPFSTSWPMRISASSVGVLPPATWGVAKSLPYHVARFAALKSLESMKRAALDESFITWKPTRNVLSTMLNAIDVVVLAARMRDRSTSTSSRSWSSPGRTCACRSSR